MNTGGSAEDLYATIRDFLATSPDAATTQAQMRQYGISGEDVANATGGASGGLLSGNILSGASWNSLNPTLAAELTEATGQTTSNYAVGGATTSDTLTQLNTYLAGGGQFDPNATVFLQTGGVDFLQGVDKGTIKDNINQIVKTLADQGVNVVLTGSPYAASINDVVTNNFDPKVDPLFNEIAKENKNVALVGTQGEILQNKKLLVDALHTNAEGTAIYNQSVIDAMSQFKNEVPSSTPDAIKQVQTSNVVATTPAQITQIAQTGQSMPVIPTARGRVIEGDNIEQQIAGVPQVVYETRVDPNNTANYETFNPKTGEVIDRGTFAGGGSKGLLEASRPVLALAASVLGAPYLSNLIAGSTGLTGSALAGATGATIAGGSTALTGGSTEDTLRAALLGGGGAYAGSALKDYIASLDVPVDFTNMTPEQIADATETNLINDLKRAGLSNAQIDDFITNSGGTAVTTPVSTSVADANAVNITAPASLGNVINTIGSTVPALTVTGDRQVDQQTLNAVTNALITNAPETVKITDNKQLTADQVVNLLATTPNAPVTQPIPQQTIISQKPSSITDAITAATIPLIQPTTPLEVPKVIAEKPTTVDPLRVAQLGLTAAGLLGAGSALSSSGTPTGFDIVPIPETFLTPKAPSVAPFTPLPPINFGDRNLLIGTQWEKFLDPNYGKVPEPIKYSQPSNMSYNDLMSILGSKQGMPSAGNLSINDIISGIQNQYGQTPTRTMG